MKKLLLALICMGMSTGAVAGDVAAGKKKSNTCAACHAADGNSTIADNPKLAGQHEAYLLKQLKEFKAGERQNAIMAGQVANLSKKDMADLAAYFASNEIKAGEGDMTKVALGEQIYRGGNTATGVPACMGCHGPTAAGNPAAKFPHLAGQHAKYIVTQLKSFQKGERANDAGKMMRNVAARMSEKEMQAVAEYIAGLRP